MERRHTEADVKGCMVSEEEGLMEIREKVVNFVSCHTREYSHYCYYH